MFNDYEINVSFCLPTSLGPVGVSTIDVAHAVFSDQLTTQSSATTNHKFVISGRQVIKNLWASISKTIYRVRTVSHLLKLANRLLRSVVKPIASSNQLQFLLIRPIKLLGRIHKLFKSDFITLSALIHTLCTPCLTFMSYHLSPIVLQSMLGKTNRCLIKFVETGENHINKHVIQHDN